MNALLAALDLVIGVTRPIFLGLVAALAVIATLDWLVRTRRISPFGPVARALHRHVDPLLAPVERRVARAGGMPAHAPFWTLMVAVLAGIIVIGGLGFLRNQLAFVAASLGGGLRGIYGLTVTWAFTLLQIAIVVRVVMSWIHLRPGAWYVRWSYRLSEPILRPIRNVVPLMGMIDFSPIIAWFALGVVESLLLAIWR